MKTRDEELSRVVFPRKAALLLPASVLLLVSMATCQPSTSTGEDISAEYPFVSRYVEVHGSKMHYVEEGSGDPILLLHGNPTSSYLWRNVIPHLSPLGRAIAPDLIGYGKSDKPTIEYRVFDQIKYMEGFIKALGLEDITLVVHDWGSAVGLHIAMAHPELIKAIASPIKPPTTIAVSNPRIGLPVLNTTRNPLKAPINIMPSTPRFNTPDRCENISPRAAYR